MNTDLAGLHEFSASGTTFGKTEKKIYPPCNYANSTNVKITAYRPSCTISLKNLAILCPGL